jgi:hypothetical protein
VSQDYDWNATGYNYFATGIGLHHVTIDDTTSSQQARHNIIYNSMMKCGSSSVNGALKELPKASKEYFPGASNKMKVVYQGKQQTLMAGPSQTLMQALYQYQHQEASLSTKNGTFQYFTTVRDPVKRFVSAVAQEMYVHRESDRKAQHFRTKCLKDAPQKTLACAIGHVEERFSGKPLNRPHFIPMTTVLYRRSYGYNASVLLFDMHQVNAIVSPMVAPSRLGEFKNKRNKLKTQGSQVLKNMTTSHLSTKMIEKICQLYEMDARLMMMAGFRTMCANPDGRQTKN